jgi:ppGpp synthetase/RelA/SpoT-type nucleotidyltranferase
MRQRLGVKVLYSHNPAHSVVIWLLIFVTCTLVNSDLLKAATCNSAFFTYDLLLASQDSIELAVPTRDGGYEYINIKSWAELETHLESIPKELREHHKELLLFAKKHFQDVVSKYKILAKNAHGVLRTRLKEPDSLTAKIVDRARNYNLRGLQFKDSDLHDLIGMRLALPVGSPKLALGSNVMAWAKVLEIDPSQIIEIEIKDKNYRATHLTILDTAGVEFELQVMSKLVAHWHSWDHRKVYKPNSHDLLNKTNLKKYSAAWIQIIKILEDVQTGKIKKEELSNLWQTFGWQSNSGATWMFSLDRHLRKLYSLSSEDSILAEKNIDPQNPTWNRNLIKELGVILSEINPN